MRNKRSKKKIFGSLALVFLTLSAGLLPLSAINDGDNNPEKTASAFSGLPQPKWPQITSPDFDYIDYLNKEYSEPLGKEDYLPGESIKDANTLVELNKQETNKLVEEK